MKTDQELKQIAADYYDGKIFSTTEMNGPNMVHLSMVFMPILLGAFKEESSTKDVEWIYEYYDKAGPRGINGMPIFTSLRYLSRDEFKRMVDFFEMYKNVKENFLAPQPPKGE